MTESYESALDRYMFVSHVLTAIELVRGIHSRL
jgi:hypothetical protein